MSSIANKLVQEGRRLESQGALVEALALYDHARLELERTADASGSEVSVVCMNRGSALARLDSSHLPAALAAYDEAIALKRENRDRTKAEHDISLAAALMNRGSLLHRAYGIQHAAATVAAFNEAEALLKALRSTSEDVWVRRNLAGTLLNRASFEMDLRDYGKAYETAREAVVLVCGSERQHVIDAEISLKARRLVCDALGHLFVTPNADQETLAHTASDAVDEAMLLARHWMSAGVQEFRPLARRLFRFGAQLYRLHQPHFLAEFLQENFSEISRDPAFRAIARENIAAALDDFSRPQIFTVGNPASERCVTATHVLRHLLSRLPS